MSAGLRFNFIGYDTWHKLYQSMLAGKIDVISSITPTTLRKEKLLFSNEFWQAPWAILHPQYMGQQSQLSNFYGRSLAIVKGFYLVGYCEKSIL